jgi:hypothetical protein
LSTFAGRPALGYLEGMTEAWRLLRDTVGEWYEDRAQRLGAALAFYTLFALAPGLVILIPLTGQLSIIKTISPELKSLLERISETSKVTAKELETLARINPPLNLEVSHLPTIERAARDSIDKETTKQILRSTGVDLEFNMVSSQLAAMNYAAHLARSLAVVETNPRRKEFLQRTDRKFSDLHSQVYKMLFTRYQR